MTKHHDLDTCNCCDPDIETPSLHNPPGQDELDYRIGTHSAFLRRMITRIPKHEIPDGDFAGNRPLAASTLVDGKPGLTTRSSDDPSIALLDAWAVVGDVLTFYQERIANEHYLRTATERRSVLALARTIGYELNPGITAETHLAFTLDNSAAAPAYVEISKGTQVQSLPKESGEFPQTFETSDDFTAYPEWNELHPQLTEKQIISFATTKLYLTGTTNKLKPGDMLLLVQENNSGTAIANEMRRILTVETDADNDLTMVEIEPSTVSQTVSLVEAITVTASTRDKLPFNADNVAALFKRKLNEDEFQAFIQSNDWDPQDVMAMAEDWNTEGSSNYKVFVFRQKEAFFGYNAPRQELLPPVTSTRGTVDPYALPWDDTSARTIWQNSQGTTYAEADAYLARDIKDIVVGSWIAIEARSGSSSVRKVYSAIEAFESSLVDFGISGKTTGLLLGDINGTRITSKPSTLKVRKSTAFFESEELELAILPVTDDVVAADELTMEELILGLSAGQAIAFTGAQADAAGIQRSEVLEIDKITHEDGRTTLKFDSSLDYGYARETLLINANTIKATHGETVSNESLGSGSGSIKNQKFALNKAPLTHVSAATASGSEAVLTIRVDNVEWMQVNSLYGLEKRDRKYIVRIDNEATATVIFGNGVMGSRLPSGSENVKATYRAGIGQDGMVGEGALSLLKTRPFGVKGVSNPLAASGGTDPETLDNARKNAPYTVLTLDRIVSLQDYEDFARAFTGIGKAKAVAVWDGEAQIVHITIAGEEGAEIEDTSTLYENLLDAINDARDPLQDVRLGSYQPLYFDLDANIIFNSDYVWDLVEAEIEDALKDAFSFDNRAFGQPATAAEIISIIHEIEGVTAVDIDELYTIDDSGNRVGPLFASVLRSRNAQPLSSGILPAQLLMINKSGISLTKL